MLLNKILIVEDDTKINKLLTDYFMKAGFNVSDFESGDQIVSKVKASPPDLIILDIMFQGKDRVSLFRESRTFSEAPILMLNVKLDETDCVLVLELCSDDFMCKSFSSREVVCGIKDILRRTPDRSTEKKLIIGAMTIDLENYIVTIPKKYLYLNWIEVELLKLMARKPNKSFTRGDFVTNVRVDNFNSTKNKIDNLFEDLRKKIDKLWPGNNLIRTVYGKGYSIKIPNNLSV